MSNKFPSTFLFVFILTLLACNKMFGQQNLNFVKAGKITSNFLSHNRLAVADFNNDGYNDIVATNFIVMEVRMYLNDGYGFFESIEIVGYSTEPESVFVYVDVTDANNDGFIDIIVLEHYIDHTAVAPQQVTIGRIVTYLNDGHANFTKYSYTDFPDVLFVNGTCVIDDIDQDGDSDIAIAPFRKKDFDSIDLIRYMVI